MAEEKRGVTALRRAVLPLLFSEWWGSHHLDLEVCQNGCYPLSPLSRGRLFSSVQSHRDYRSPRSPLRGSLLRGSLLRGSLLRGSLWCLQAIYEYFSFFFINEVNIYTMVSTNGNKTDSICHLQVNYEVFMLQ